MRKAFLALTGLALVASASFASLATVSGADHRDSPMNVANPTADINDVYAFRSLEDPNNVVVAISVNPLIVPTDNSSRGVFDRSVGFQVHIDRNGNLTDEATARITVNSAQDQLTIAGLGASISAPITPPDAAPIVTNASGIKIFAGLRDDPFFFDLVSFQNFLANPKAPEKGLRPAGGGEPTDTFAGTNILAIVIELPVTAVTGGSSANSGTVKAWVSSTKDGRRIDRMAIPAINTALIATGQKDGFNELNPILDETARPAAINRIEVLRGVVDGLFVGPETQDGGPLGKLTASQVGTALIPDVVTIDFSKPVQFPNGRRLQDDVIDTALGLVLNRGGARGVGDGVSANDRPFGSTFPYLAEPHRAAGASPPGTGVVRPPSTGDGGLLDDSATMWTLSAASFLVALSLGGVGAFAALRRHSR